MEQPFKKKYCLRSFAFRFEPFFEKRYLKVDYLIISLLDSKIEILVIFELTAYCWRADKTKGDQVQIELLSIFYCRGLVAMSFSKNNIARSDTPDWD